jgi:hypothetical protein
MHSLLITKSSCPKCFAVECIVPIFAFISAQGVLPAPLATLHEESWQLVGGGGGVALRQ